MGKGTGFERQETWSVIAMAITVGCLPALMPVLLGALLDEHRITPDQVGHIATAEALGRVIANVLAGALLPPVRLRTIALLSALVMAVTNGVIAFADPVTIIIARFCNGVAAGMVLWMLVGLMARVSQPGRLFAVYVTILSAATFLLSSLLVAILIPHWGSSGGYGALMLLVAVPLALSFFIPRQYPVNDAASGVRRPTTAGLVGLLAVFLFMSGIFAIWVYIGAVAKQVGHSPIETGRAINYAIGVQILGGFAAMRVADKWNASVTTAFAAIAAASCTLGLLFMPQTWALYGSAGLIAIIWTFAPSFHLPMVLDFDRSGRSAIFIGTAQLSGIAMGPLLSSLLITDGDFRGAVMASVAAFFGCGLLLAAAAGYRHMARRA